MRRMDDIDYKELGVGLGPWDGESTMPVRITSMTYRV